MIAVMYLTQGGSPHQTYRVSTEKQLIALCKKLLKQAARKLKPRRPAA